MSRIDDWKKAKKTREQAEQWLNMRTQNAEYDRKPHVPRMDVNAKMYMCGQAYAGAPNYHEPPKEMVEAFCEHISEQWLPIAQTALETLKAKEAEALLAAKSELEEALADMGTTI